MYTSRLWRLAMACRPLFVTLGGYPALPRAIRTGVTVRIGGN
jgi:hypothetical protein